MTKYQDLENFNDRETLKSLVNKFCPRIQLEVIRKEQDNQELLSPDRKQFQKFRIDFLVAVCNRIFLEVFSKYGNDQNFTALQKTFQDRYRFLRDNVGPIFGVAFNNIMYKNIEILETTDNPNSFKEYSLEFQQRVVPAFVV